MVTREPTSKSTNRQQSDGTVDLCGRAVQLSPDARCLVVMYHYVHEGETVSLPSPAAAKLPQGVVGLTPGEFSRQLDQLCFALEPIDWPMLFAWREGRASIPERSFLLTFDDGLADHWRYVVPILQRRKLHGTFFVPGATLTSHSLLSAHAVHLLLTVLDDETLTRELSEKILQDQGADAQRYLAIDEQAALKLYHYESPERARLKYLLAIALPSEMSDRAIHALFTRHIGSPKRWAKHWYLGWDELVQMQSMGHTIGGHGFAHRAYTGLSPEACRADVLRVGTVLRDGLGSEPRPFSYPYGRVEPSLSDAFRQAGFVHAFTTQTRWLTSECDTFSMPRFDTIAVNAALDRGAVCPQTS